MGRPAGLRHHRRLPGHRQLSRQLVRAACALACVATGATACATGADDQPAPPSAAVTSPTQDGTSVPASTATPGATDSPRATDSPGATDTGDSSTPAPDLSHLVIVTFAVDWQPEPELSTSELAAQRDRIEQAQQAVLDVLGPQGRLVRELHATAQASLSVSDDGLARLDTLPEVAAVDEDTPDPPDAAG